MKLQGKTAIVTGGGSGVMEQANTLARERGILSGANFLEITDQSITTDVDFCQVFQATCRHSRQKWFEIASFPIFNIGGLGSLEELGITFSSPWPGNANVSPVLSPRWLSSPSARLEIVVNDHGHEG